MTEPAPSPPSPPRNRRFWLTVGEVVAVAGLVLAGVNFWDSRQERTTAEQRQAQAEAEQKARAAKASVFIMRGTADEDGERVMLEPLRPEQVVMSQRYLFPAKVLDHGKEIAAGRPQIDLVWFEKGLREALKAARKDGARLPEGEAQLPVGVLTTYIEAGETRTDASLYRVGYVANPGLLGAVKLKLVGVSLSRRGVAGDLQGAVDAAWSAAAPKSAK